MADLANFKKYKFLYLFLLLAVFVSCAFFASPIYREVYTDISLSPPKEARQTDFSWITVNEYFNTQTRLITSPSLLAEAGYKDGANTVLKNARARRLGASDIIRLTVRSNEGIEELKNTAGRIADTYLAVLSRAAKKAVIEKPLFDTRKDGGNGAMEALEKQKKELSLQIESMTKDIAIQKIELAALEKKIADYRSVKSQADAIEGSIAPLKAELSDLSAKYTDSWPAVAALMRKMDSLKRDRQALEVRLEGFSETETEAGKLKAKITADDEALSSMRRTLGNITASIDKVEKGMPAPAVNEEQVLKKTADAEIITPPTEIERSDLVVRLSAGAVLAFAAWLILGLILTNLYLFYIWKSRIFNK